MTTPTVLSPNVAEVLKRGRESYGTFEEFCRFTLGFAPAKHQADWVQYLQELADDPKRKKLCIVAPPGSGKTQLVGVGFMAWMIGRSPEAHHGLLSYSDQVGWSRSRAIKQIIEGSKPYHITFPGVQKSRVKWGDTEFILDRPNLQDPHPTLRAGGTLSAVVAYRLDGLLIDDPHDQKNSANPTLRNKVYKNYEDAIKTRLVSNAWQVVIGTRWADDDFIGQLTKQRGWKVLHTPALGNDGKSYWPEAYPTGHLTQLRYESPSLFSMQYMGDTTGGESGIIKSIGQYRSSELRGRIDGSGKTFLDDLLIVAAWDTAFKKRQENDFTVGYVGGMDRYGRIYVLDRIKGRFGLPELLDQISMVHQKWAPVYQWIEDAASGTSAIQVLQSETYLPVVPVSYSGDKHTRAHALAPYLHGGHVVFPDDAEWAADARHLITHFPNAAHDDDMDALFILTDNLTKLRHPSSILDRPQPIFRMG